VDVEGVIEAHYQQLRHSAAFRTRAPGERDLRPPAGSDRKVGDYQSLQHQFPGAYGIGTMGLPDSAGPQRKAEARQLKAFLLFFDQLLANYFAQLVHAKDLFSFSSSNAPQTYFSRMIDDPELGLEEIRPADPDVHRARLQQVTEDPGTDRSVAAPRTGLRRRTRFLNHLMARFAEQFTDYSLILYGLVPGKGTSAAEKLVQDKQAFLQDYPQISSARGTALDYLIPRGSANLSGLEKRIQRKLGIVDPEEGFYIVEHILLRPMEGDIQQKVAFLEDSPLRDPFSLQLSVVIPEWPSRFQDPGFRRLTERTIREETPAHLTPSIRWLNKDDMATFTSAYEDWLNKRRSYWTDQLGL
jgi:hypothetical protein